MLQCAALSDFSLAILSCFKMRINNGLKYIFVQQLFWNHWSWFKVWLQFVGANYVNDINLNVHQAPTTKIALFGTLTQSNSTRVCSQLSVNCSIWGEKLLFWQNILEFTPLYFWHLKTGQRCNNWFQSALVLWG